MFFFKFLSKWNCCIGHIQSFSCAIFIANGYMCLRHGKNDVRVIITILSMDLSQLKSYSIEWFVIADDFNVTDESSSSSSTDSVSILNTSFQSFCSATFFVTLLTKIKVEWTGFSWIMYTQKTNTKQHNPFAIYCWWKQYAFLVCYVIRLSVCTCLLCISYEFSHTCEQEKKHAHTQAHSFKSSNKMNQFNKMLSLPPPPPPLVLFVKNCHSCNATSYAWRPQNTIQKVFTCLKSMRIHISPMTDLLFFIISKHFTFSTQQNWFSSGFIFFVFLFAINTKQCFGWRSQIAFDLGVLFFDLLLSFFFSICSGRNFL